jgi:hypothetical protein
MLVLLRQAIGALPTGAGRPRVLLTTVPEEQHVLGLLMTEALLTRQGVRLITHLTVAMAALSDWREKAGA